MTDSELKAIEAREAAASQKPWFVHPKSGDICYGEPDDDRNNYPIDNPEDFDFIAHARTDIPALLEHIRQLPQWHDRPTGPGLWYVPQSNTVEGWSQSSFEKCKGLGWFGGRVFGPIPADEKGGAST